MTLRNRILVAGFENNHLDLLNKVEGSYLLISINSSNKTKQNLDHFEVVLLTEEFLLANAHIVSQFENKPIFTYSQRDLGSPFIHLPPPLRPEKVKEKFDLHFPETRPPSAETGEIKPGLVVKNKVFPA